MKYKVVFDFDDTYTKRSLDIECENVEDIGDVISNGNLNNQIEVVFEDLISDAVKVDNSAGRITQDEAHEIVYWFAYSNLSDSIREARVDIISDEKLEVSTNIKEKIISALDDTLFNILTDRESSEQGTKDEVAASITSVKNFMAEGSWHFGLIEGDFDEADEEIGEDSRAVITDVKQWPKPIIKGKKVTWIQDNEVLKPVLWFTNDIRNPLLIYWCIYGTREGLTKNHSVWFPLSKNTLGATEFDVEAVTKYGMDVPELDDEIIKQCPIALSEEDTIDSVLDKINQFFLSQYDKVHGQNELTQFGKTYEAGLNKYHFIEDNAYSDNVIIAQKASHSVKAEYKLEKTDESRITIPNSTLRYGMDYSPKLHEDLVAFINQYNDYIDFLNNLPGFVSVFVENGLMISKEKALTLWPKKTVDKMFSLNESRFITPLIINKGILYDNYYVTNYTASIEGEGFVLPIGKNEDAYPTKNNGKKCIWNWDNNGHDFTYALWRLLGERSVKDEDTYTGEADDDQVYYGFDNYDDIYRFSVEVEIQFIKIFEKLEKLGYLETYTIKPEAYDVRWCQYGKSDCSIDLALVDESFKKNKLLMEQIELLMWSKPEALEKPYYFLTDKDNKQYLSDTPGQFGGHRKLKIYGRLDCPSANRYVQQGEYVKHRVFFKDEATAIAAGYRPCAKCMPEAYKKWKEKK